LRGDETTNQFTICRDEFPNHYRMGPGSSADPHDSLEPEQSHELLGVENVD